MVFRTGGLGAPSGPSRSRGAHSAPQRWRRGRGGAVSRVWAPVGEAEWVVGFAPSPPPPGTGRERCGWSRGGKGGVPSRRAWGWRSLALALRDRGSQRHSPTSPSSWRLPPIPDPPDPTHPQRLKNSSRRPSPLTPPANSLEGGGWGGLLSASRQPVLRTQFWHRLTPSQPSRAVPPARPGCPVPLRCGDT